MKIENKVFKSADKSRNIYKLENDHTNKKMKEDVTKPYKKQGKLQGTRNRSFYDKQKSKRELPL